MIASHSRSRSASRIAAESSTRSECTLKPAFCNARRISAASLSESSTCRIWSRLPNMRRSLVGYQPIQTQLLDDLEKLLEIDGLADVTVHAVIVSGTAILLFVGRRQD